MIFLSRLSAEDRKISVLAPVGYYEMQLETQQGEIIACTTLQAVHVLNCVILVRTKRL